VLSSGQDQDAESRAKQTALLELSSDSQQLFADRSGHNVQHDQPEAAVAAIMQIVEQVRGQAPR